jgi:parallel beta-helix repeat protein
MSARTLGYYTVNDGGGALFIIRANNSDINNGSTIILSNNNVAEMITDGTVTPEQFGAVGDGVTNDTDAVQNALNIGERVLLRKKYAIDIEKHLFPKDNNIIIFENAELFGLPATQVSTNVYAEPIIFLKNVENITISGQGVINGNRDNQPTTPGTNEWASGIRIESSQNINISDITIVDCCGDGIEIYAGNKNIFISNILCDNNRRQGLTIGGVDGCVVTNSIFRNTNGTAPSAGIDVEVEPSYYAKNVTISNCAFFNNEIGILVGSKTSATEGYTIINLVITNCTALNNTSAGFRIEMKDGCTVSNCVAQKSSIGFWLRMCDGVILSNCSSKNNDDGITIQTCSHIKVCGSMIFENSTRGIYINQKSEDVYLSDNNIYDNKGYGLQIYGANESFKNKNIDVLNSLFFNNRTTPTYDANTGEIFVSGEAESIRVCGCIIDKPSTSTGYAIYFSDNTYGIVEKCILASFIAGAIYNANKTSNNIIDNRLVQGTMDVYALSDSKPSTAKDLIKDYEPNGTTKFFTVYWSNTSTADGLVAQTNITGRVSKITTNQYIGECTGADGRRYYFTNSNWNLFS